ncbi:MAG: hypothetical protein Q8K86_05840 [Candidatus Nanopelagicaceae bacterium]|nr:hypothetical protein [Candidatus Nanopelagicaceae bacterium]
MNGLKEEAGLCHGMLEFIIKDKNGNIVEQIRQPNIVKIFMKEVLSHRMPFNEVWNPVGGTGTGAWEATTVDPDGVFGVKYILFGASFDSHGVPLDNNDSRYYVTDPVTGQKVPIRLGVGAEYGGGLINAVPLAEPGRPLMKIETVSFEPSAQPAGTPLLNDDVRTLNNVVVLQTELKLEEYNGFGQTNSDYFTICEVALAAGRKIDHVGLCNCDPHTLFLEGHTDGTPLTATANGTDVVSLDPAELLVDLIQVGDQVKIVAPGGSADDPVAFGQVTPFYLVTSKLPGGRDILLDRVPVNTTNVPITGAVGLYKDTLRIVAHRVLSVPLRKSDNFSIIVRWSILFN